MVDTLGFPGRVASVANTLVWPLVAGAGVVLWAKARAAAAARRKLTTAPEPLVDGEQPAPLRPRPAAPPAVDN
jgi:hypothetical protein